MNKRNSLLTLVLVLLAILTGPRILAQTDMSSLDPETQAKVQARLQNISSELNLTDDQKQQLKPILQNEAQQLKSVREDTSMSPEQKKAKAKEIHSSYKSQISAILTPDQQKKLATMREEARENRK